MRPIPLGKPQSLVALPNDRLVLRLKTENGDRMATPLRAMTTRDAFAPRPLRRFHQ
jgi:hypothetical protein